MKRYNYLNNKDILLEIHKSKNTFCSYVDDDYHQYDIIIPMPTPYSTLDETLQKINIRSIAEAKRNKAKRLQHQDYDLRKAAGEKIKLAECEVNYKKIDKIKDQKYDLYIDLLKEYEKAMNADFKSQSQ